MHMAMGASAAKHAFRDAMRELEAAKDDRDWSSRLRPASFAALGPQSRTVPPNV